MISWRYLRARRAEGGVSVMTWISLIGIALAVFALIATLAVRAGFRGEFVDTILGSNAHVTVYAQQRISETGQIIRTIEGYDDMADRLADLPGVTHAAPLVTGTVLATHLQYSTGAQVLGITLEDLNGLTRIANPEDALGDIGDFGGEAIAIGAGIARQLGVGPGDMIKLISPNGAPSPMGTVPRSKSYKVAYIFTSGRPDIDNARVYMPFAEAQSFFNREGVADEIQVLVEDPETIEAMKPALEEAAGPGMFLWTWLDASGDYLRALTIEDNVMFVLMAVLVLIATMNIISGLIMLVKNKGRDIGILRTMGLTEGSVMRVFFLCGAFTGVVGTLAGVILGVTFVYYFDQIFALVSYIAGGNLWNPNVRPIVFLPAKLQWGDVLSAVSLSLTLSFVVTIFPARRAARMNPVEALRYE
jgi:lipoprotein-releasing system permease protein